MKTLEDIDQLKQSRFGRPRPRHGLKLLYWFANEGLHLDQNNVLQLNCYPENGDFGFHYFVNWKDINSHKLLPAVAFPYYILGNLNYLDSDKLPDYVREDYDRSQYKHNNNVDRIIVSLNSNCLDQVYVTEHSDCTNFKRHATYCITKDLILIIRGLSLKDFLLRTWYFKQETNSVHTNPLQLSIKQIQYLAPPTNSMWSPIQHTDSSSIMRGRNTQGHHRSPAPTEISILKSMSSKNQDIDEVDEDNGTQINHNASLPICNPEITSTTSEDIQTKEESPPALMKNGTQRNHETLLYISSSEITSTKQDIQMEMESLPILYKNSTKGNQKAPPPICSPSSNTQESQTEDESPPILKKNGTQGHHEASFPICSPAITASSTQDITMDVDATIILMKQCTQAHQAAPPTHSVCVAAAVSSTTLDIYTGIDSPQISHTESHISSMKNQLSHFVQDNTIQTVQDYNLQTPSKDIQTSQTRRAPTLESSLNQNITKGQSLVPQISFFFSEMYIVFLFFFFFFLWGTMMKLFIMIIFLLSFFPWQNGNIREQEEKKEDEAEQINKAQKR